MYTIEITDTFGGEANYCWVKRGKTRARTRRGLIAAAKRIAGWEGWCRVRVDSWCGDMLIIRPTATSGICQIAFIVYSED